MLIPFPYYYLYQVYTYCQTYFDIPSMFLYTCFGYCTQCKELVISGFFTVAGSDYQDEGVDLMPFFSPTSYNGYGDDDKVSNVH